MSCGNGSESYCPFPWKQYGETKEKEKGGAASSEFVTATGTLLTSGEGCKPEHHN